MVITAIRLSTQCGIYDDVTTWVHGLILNWKYNFIMNE